MLRLQILAQAEELWKTGTLLHRLRGQGLAAFTTDALQQSHTNKGEGMKHDITIVFDDDENLTVKNILFTIGDHLLYVDGFADEPNKMAVYPMCHIFSIVTKPTEGVRA